MNKELQRIIRFLIVGVSNVIIDVGTFNIFMALGLSPYWSAAISYTLAATNSFIHNRRWTFDDGRLYTVWQQYFMFMGANAIGYVFNLGLVYFFLHSLPLGSELLTTNAAKLLAAGLIVIWNYAVSRLVIFKPGSRQSSTGNAAKTKS